MQTGRLIKFEICKVITERSLKLTVLWNQMLFEAKALMLLIHHFDNLITLSSCSTLIR